MRIRTDQPRAAERTEERCEADARTPVATGAASSDAVRLLRAALRRAAREKAATAVDAANEALEQRANDPIEGRDLGRLANEAINPDLDAREDGTTGTPETPWRASLVELAAARPPETRILARPLDRIGTRPARDPNGQAPEAEEPDPQADGSSAPQIRTTRTPLDHRPDRSKRADREAAHDHDRPRGAQRDWRHAPPDGVKSSDATKHAEQLRKAEAEKKTGPHFKKAPSLPKKQGPAPAPKPPPAKPAPKPGAAPAKAEAGGEESSGDAQVAAWQKQQAAKVNKLESPRISDADRYVVQFQAASERALTDGEKLDIIATAQDAVKPMDQPEDVPQIPDPDALGKTVASVVSFSKKKLKESELKPLDPSPLGHVPKMGMHLKPGQDQQQHILQESKDADGKTIQQEIKVVPDDKKTPADKNTIEIRTPKPGKDQSAVDALKNLNEKGKAKHDAAVAKNLVVKGVTVSDDRPRSAPVVPPFALVDMGTVLAKVLARETFYAKQIVDASRKDFAGGKMDESETNEFIAEQKPFVEEEVEKIRGANDVTKEALAKKVAAEHDKMSGKVEEENAAAEQAALANKTVVETSTMSKQDQIDQLANSIVAMIDSKEAAAQGGYEHDQIVKKRDAAIAEQDRIANLWSREYTRMGEERETQLKATLDKELQAYAAVAEIDYRQIDLEIGVKSPSDRVYDAPEYKPTKEWVETISKETQVDVQTEIGKRKGEATKLKTEIRTADEQANDAARAWAESNFDNERSWWDKLVHAIIKWIVGARKDAKVWDDNKTRDNSKILNDDMLFLEKARIANWKELDKDQIEKSRQFTEEQKAMLLAMKSGADAPTALAASLMSHLSQEHRSGLQKEFEAKVMTMTDVGRVQEIGFGQGGPKAKDPGYAFLIAETVYDQGAGKVGTGEQETWDALQGVTKIQGHAVELAYLARFGRNLRADIDSEMNDGWEWNTHDYDKSIALLEGNSAQAAAIDLEESMHGGFMNLGLGTDTKAFFKTLKGKTPDEIAEAARQYYALTGRDLMEDAHGELDDGWSTWHDDARFRALVAGDTDRARVIQADSGMRGSAIFGLSTDKSEVTSVYSDIEAEVQTEGDAKGWSSERREQEIAARYAKFSDNYETQVGGSVPMSERKIGPDGKPESALTTVMRQSFTWGSGKGAFNFTTSNADLDELLSYQTVAQNKDSKNIKAVFQQQVATIGAAKVEAEHKSFWYASDDKENAAISSGFEAAYKNQLIDQKLALDKERDKDFADLRHRFDEQRKSAYKIGDPGERKKKLDEIKAAEKGEEKTVKRKWAPQGKEYLARMRKAHTDAETGAKADAQVTYAMMAETFDRNYQAANAMYGDASDAKFEDIVKGDTNVFGIGGFEVGGNDKTRALISGKGYLSLEDRLYYSVKGSGTDEAAAKQAFADRDSKESKEILTKLGKRLAAEDGSKFAGTQAQQDEAAYQRALAWVRDDFSGRELVDQDIAMMGVPHTPDEHKAIGKKRLDFEERSGISRFWRDDTSVVDKDGKALKIPPVAKGSGLLSDSDSITFLKWQYARLEDACNAADALANGPDHLQPGDDEYDKAMEVVSAISESVEAATELHRANVDAMTDLLTQVVQAVITVITLVVGIILTPVTGGLSTAIAIAVIGALVTAAATMAVKAVMKGDAYGAEEIWTDVAVGLVDALVAGLTAGFGGPMTKGLGLAKVEGEAAIKALVRSTASHFVMGAVGAAPGVFLGTLLNDGSFTDALGGIFQAGMMSVAMGHITGPVAEHFHEQKAIRTRTNPVEFEKGFKSFAKENPGATRAKYAQVIDHMVFQLNPEAMKEPVYHEAMRRSVLGALPPEAHAAFKNATIEMVGEAEFLKRGGAKNGRVIVMVEDGAPKVFARAGTDLSALTPKELGVTPGKPVPHGASESPGAPKIESTVKAAAAVDKKVILEPFTGPSLDSAVALAAQHPDATVIATERTLKPNAEHVASLEKAGGVFVPENKSAAIPLNSVDEIKMRFPIPTERTMEQDFIKRLSEVEAAHPEMPKGEQLKLAAKMTEHLAESLTAYAPYALERLKPGGAMEVVFKEPSILGELGDIGKLRFIDPETGRGYRLEVVDVGMAPRGEVAPHSGFGLRGMTNETEVHVVRFRKVQLEEVRSTTTGRRFTPELAGGDVQKLSFEKIKFTEKGVDVVEQHLKRMGSGEMEMAMLERLRAIHRGEIEATPFDKAFYSHELRESVRYRRMAATEEMLANPDLRHELWNHAHSATLEDYGLPEWKDGKRTLFHPDIPEEGGGTATGARGPRERPNVPWDTEQPLGYRPGDATAQSEGGRCATWVWVEALRNAGWVGAVASEPGQVARLVRQLRDPLTGEKLPRTKGSPADLMAQAKTLAPGSQIVISALSENGVWHAMLGRVNPDGTLELMHGPRATYAGNDRIYFAERADLAKFTEHRWWVLPPLPEAPPHLGLRTLPPELELHGPLRRGLAEGKTLPVESRRMLERVLIDGDVPKALVKSMSDAELVAANRARAIEEVPRKLAELRETVGQKQRAVFDSLVEDPHIGTQEVTRPTADRMEEAFGVKVHTDVPGLEPREIRVVPLDGPLGGVEIQMGKGARVGDALLHAGEVVDGKKLSGFMGLARRVYGAVESLVKTGRLPIRDTIGGEALRELHKLPGIIEAKRAYLLDPATDPVLRFQIHTEVANLEAQFVRHIDELVERAPGRGYVASEGVKEGGGAAAGPRSAAELEYLRTLREVAHAFMENEVPSLLSPDPAVRAEAESRLQAMRDRASASEAVIKRRAAGPDIENKANKPPELVKREPGKRALVREGHAAFAPEDPMDILVLKRAIAEDPKRFRNGIDLAMASIDGVEGLVNVKKGESRSVRPVDRETGVPAEKGHGYGWYRDQLAKLDSTEIGFALGQLQMGRELPAKYAPFREALTELRAVMLEVELHRDSRNLLFSAMAHEMLINGKLVGGEVVPFTMDDLLGSHPARMQGAAVGFRATAAEVGGPPQLVKKESWGLKTLLRGQELTEAQKISVLRDMSAERQIELVKQWQQRFHPGTSFEDLPRQLADLLHQYYIARGQAP